VKPKETKSKVKTGDGERPILAVRVPHGVWNTLEELRREYHDEFQRTDFVVAAIKEKLEREYNADWLRKAGYVLPEGIRKVP
jgi:hypothetical protein